MALRVDPIALNRSPDLNRMFYWKHPFCHSYFKPSFLLEFNLLCSIQPIQSLNRSKLGPKSCIASSINFTLSSQSKSIFGINETFSGGDGKTLTFHSDGSLTDKAAIRFNFPSNIRRLFQVGVSALQGNFPLGQDTRTFNHCPKILPRDLDIVVPVLLFPPGPSVL